MNKYLKLLGLCLADHVEGIVGLQLAPQVVDLLQVHSAHHIHTFTGFLSKFYLIFPQFSYTLS